MKKRRIPWVAGLIILFVAACLFILIWNYSPPQSGAPHAGIPTVEATLSASPSPVQPSETPSPTLAPTETNAAAVTQSPDAAQVDQARDMRLIRELLDQPHLQLTYSGIENLANAPWVNAALYIDESMNRYSVASDAGVVAAIEPLSIPNLAAAEIKPVETIRPIAEAFVRAHSPNFVKFQNQLTFEQGGKGNIYFFTWRLTHQDWSATLWKMMPPFLQVGFYANGKLATYLNTLDLYHP